MLMLGPLGAGAAAAAAAAARRGAERARAAAVVVGAGTGVRRKWTQSSALWGKGVAWEKDGCVRTVYFTGRTGNRLRFMRIKLLASRLNEWDTTRGNFAVKAILLRGSEECFSEGLVHMDSPKQYSQYLDMAFRLLHRVHTYQGPLISVLRGEASGAGLSLAMSPYRVVEPDFLYSPNDATKYGVWPGGGVLFYLTHCDISPAMARFLLLTGQPLNHNDLHDILGLTTHRTLCSDAMDDFAETYGDTLAINYDDYMNDEFQVEALRAALDNVSDTWIDQAAALVDEKFYMPDMDALPEAAPLPDVPCLADVNMAAVERIFRDEPGRGIEHVLHDLQELRQERWAATARDALVRVPPLLAHAVYSFVPRAVNMTLEDVLRHDKRVLLRLRKWRPKAIPADQVDTADWSLDSAQQERLEELFSPFTAAEEEFHLRRRRPTRGRRRRSTTALEAAKQESTGESESDAEPQPEWAPEEAVYTDKQWLTADTIQSDDGHVRPIGGVRRGELFLAEETLVDAVQRAVESETRGTRIRKKDRALWEKEKALDQQHGSASS